MASRIGRARPARLLFLLGLLVAAIAVALFTHRRWIVETAVRATLDRAGYPDVAMNVGRVSFGEIVVTAISAGDLLRVDRVVVGIELGKLPDWPIDFVEIHGVDADLSGPLRDWTEDGDEAAPAWTEWPGLPPVRVSQVRLHAAWPDGRFDVRGRARLGSDGLGETSWSGTATTAAGSARVEVDGRIGADGRARLRVEVPELSADFPGAAAAFEMSLEIEGEAPFPSSRSMGPFRGRISAATENARAGDTAIGRIRVDAPFTATVDGDAWTITVDGGRIELPDRGYRLSAIEGGLSWPGLEDTRVRVGRLESTAPNALFEPLAVTFRVPSISDVFAFTADAAVLGTTATARAEGSVDTRGGTAEATIVLPRTEFRRGGLQPRALSRLTEGVQDVRGAVSATIDARWTGGDLTSGGTIEIGGLSFSAAGISVDGLTTAAALESLWPPATRGTQELTLGSVAAGIDLGDLAVGWALAAVGDASRLSVPKARATFLGGRVEIDDAVLDPFADANEVTLGFVDVDVARVFAFAGVPDVSGTGRLSGSLPVRVEGGRTAISEGRLETNEPGVLRIRSERMAQMLSGGGESVDLLVRALRDFHYEKLALGVTKSLDGEARLTLELDGRNPAVLEGHPFDINVNLTGNVDRLVGALADLIRLADLAVRATVAPR